MAQTDTRTDVHHQPISREAVIAVRNRAITLALFAAREGDSQRYAVAQGMATATSNILSVGQALADNDQRLDGYTAPSGWERTWASLPDDGNFPRLRLVLDRLLTEEADISGQLVANINSQAGNLNEHSELTPAIVNLDKKPAVASVDLTNDQSLLHVALPDGETAIVATEGGAA